MTDMKVSTLRSSPPSPAASVYNSDTNVTSSGFVIAAWPVATVSAASLPFRVWGVAHRASRKLGT